jgi:hypothetical protein
MLPLCYAQDSIVYKRITYLDSLSTDNYLPLVIGNVYQFVDVYHISGTQYNNVIYTTKVTDTVTISGKLFYKVTGYYGDGQFYFYYDQANKKIYRTNSPASTPYVYFNLNIPNDSQYVSGDEIVKSVNVDNTRGLYTNNRRETIHRNLGFYEGTNGVADYYQYHTFYFKNALLKNGNITYNIGNNFKATISYTPINILTSNSWHLQYKMYHGDDIQWYPPDEFLFNYVDNTYMESYYKKDNDSVKMPDKLIPRQLDHVSVTDTYITLDSILLSRNYKFYYRFRATDKYLMPNTVYFPETGYYSLSSLLDVNDKNIKDLNYSLKQNYPNPFNPSTNINYYIPFESKVNITVYNTLGAKIKELVNSNEAQGNYEVKFDGMGLASGIYFVTLKAASADGRQSFTSSKKMILMK